MDTFGNYSTWSPAPYTKGKKTYPALARSRHAMRTGLLHHGVVHVVSGAD